jgi:RHS repeat-associated protein
MQGQYDDGNTGLYYNTFRYYDADAGRFSSEDPISLKGGVNLYQYAPNPVRWADPLGLETYKCTKPLDVLGDKWGPRFYPESWYNPSPLYHQYICIKLKNGKYQCGGQRSADGDSFGPGAPSEDVWNSERCEKIESDNDCIEQCITVKFGGPRPYYGVATIGTNCQEWADDAVKDCRKQCKKKK